MFWFACMVRASIPLNLGVRMWKPNPKFSWPFWPNPGEARRFSNLVVEIMSCVLIPLMFSERSQQLHTCSNDIVACGFGRCLWDVSMQTKRGNIYTHIYTYIYTDLSDVPRAKSCEKQSQFCISISSCACCGMRVANKMQVISGMCAHILWKHARKHAQACEAMSECELHIAACEHKSVSRCEFACAQTKLCVHRVVQVCAGMFYI